MRIAIPMMLFALPVAAAEPGAVAATPAPSLECESRNNGERIEFRCPLRDADQHYHFVARFSGGHDDTMASMVVTHGEQPVHCAQGSKTELMGEFGDVALECRFSVVHTAAPAAPLMIVVKYGHAQYEGFELRPQPH